MSTNSLWTSGSETGRDRISTKKAEDIVPPNMGQLTDGVWVIKTESSPKFIRRVAEKLADLPDPVPVSALEQRRTILRAAIQEAMEGQKLEAVVENSKNGGFTVRLPNLDADAITTAIINALCDRERHEETAKLEEALSTLDV